MINIKDKKDCCGCTACASICAHHAILMEPDSLGFYYPKVDESLCVNCSLCDNVCQFKTNYKRFDNYDKPLVFGARHKELSQLSKSQSGALSFALIDKFLEKEGVVYGVAFSKGFHVVHKRATTMDECEEFRGSKYVQSDLNGIFHSVKNDLKEGNRVLFFGTSCQIGGLRSYIPKKLHQKLLTVDIVCHATSSPRVWEEYIKWIEKKYNQKVQIAKFRNKRFGWRSCVETFLLSDYELERTTFRFFFYFNHLAIRKSCANCYYTNLNRIGDISLGDFWGWSKYHVEWNDNKGVSLVLVNSEKGRIFYESLETVDSILSNTNECIQPQLLGPVNINPKHDIFVSDFAKYGFEYCGRKYGDLSLRYKITNFFKVTIKEYSWYKKLRNIKKRL